jgi:hypothetical protein
MPDDIISKTIAFFTECHGLETCARKLNVSPAVTSVFRRLAEKYRHISGIGYWGELIIHVYINMAFCVTANMFKTQRAQGTE